ncbi:MAG TPA: AAA family ATPase [Anaerohalosphaeraceae bacterium]|nr:AAA family ATPase [Anaerohalosphaeraceae bacterium]
MSFSGNGFFHRIKSFSILGGFLDGLELNFNSGLNCLIGHRGTGKTTVLEFVRYALDAFPNGEKGIVSRKRVESLVKNNLGDGRIRLTIETKDGLEYIIDRTASGDPMVLNSDGTPTDISINSGGIFNADIFSQNEVENIADNPQSQLSLIDNFRAAEIAEINAQIATLKSQLQANANEIIPTQKNLSGLAEELNTLPGIEVKIAALAGPKDESTAHVNKAHTDRALREREQQAFGELSDLLDKYKEWFSSATGKFARQVNGLITADFLQGANGRIFQDIQGDLVALGGRLDALFNQGTASIQSQQQSLEQRRQELSQVHDKQELVFRDMITKHTQAQGVATERANWEKKRNDLLGKKRKSQQLQEQLQQLQTKRTELMGRLQTLYNQRFEIRKAVAQWITENVSSPIRVQVDQFGDRSEYQNLLRDSLKNIGIQQGVVAKKIADLLPPNELVSILETGAAEDLQNGAELSSSQAQKVFGALKSSDTFLALDVVELADLPRIELKDGDEFKNSLTLSTGQKCTTILPILLLDSDNPLLVDQPEDNLDNRFIYDTVVDSIRRVNQRRQIILITHNPNIPVLGEASRVFVLTSNGQHARILNHGDVDTCKEEIINLLEGGRDAFVQRKQRYNY